jgi:hypothetical protein
LNTGRHDKFQGIDFRYNLDPGFKYLFINTAPTSLWGEAGYDLQYDIRNDSALTVMTDSGATEMLAKHATDHSLRAFAGLKHAFNPSVTLTTGVEFLQSLVHGDHNRLNFDMLLTAALGKGLSFGFGFAARYDHAPLPGKHKLDTTSTVSLIYAYSDKVAEAPAEPPPPVPCPEPAPPPPPASTAPPTPAAPEAAPPLPAAPQAPEPAPATGDTNAAPTAPAPPATPATPAPGAAPTP